MRKPFVDIHGNIYSMLTVIKNTNSSTSQYRNKWECLCRCGKIKLVSLENLLFGKVKSCGSCFKKQQKLNIIGEKYSLLTILEQKLINGKYYVYCICDCGNTHQTFMSRVRNGECKSCGCLKHKKGSDSHSYKKDIPDSIRSKWRDPRHKQWAKKIILYNNSECCKCKSKINLCAHHLNGYKQYPERQLGIDNGVCLCSKCHHQYHIEYGKKTIIKSDFHKWMNLPPWDDNIPRLIDLLKSASEEELRFIDSITKPFENIDQELEALKNGIMYINERINKATK